MQLTPALSLTLVHDLLLAKGGIALPQSHGLRSSIERHKGRLSSEFTRARLRRKAPSLEFLKSQIDEAAAGEETKHPRWVRINALKSCIEDELETTFRQYARAGSIQEVATKKQKQIYIDPHVPNLVAITPSADMSKTDAYLSGKIILQDKASCFPAYLLDPRSEDGDVVDACAAPGNKTTHLASILYSHMPEFDTPPQTIYAFEKDSRRAQTLEKMVKIAGSKKMTRIGLGQDFLEVDPNAERYKDVGALLLDPSCSGSGIVGRDSMPELHLPNTPQQQQQQQQQKGRNGTTGKGPENNRKRKQDESGVDNADQVIIDDDGNETVVKSAKDLTERLDALAGFQLTLLLHAFKFPSAKKITYSTCSVHSQENEHVIVKALKSKVAKERGWRILRRDEQVTGMREWPVRGLIESSDGDKDVAEGCIRSYKDDGHGIMGFFVAGFVRDGTKDANSAESEDGPYLRDEDGAIIRDVLGMPTLKATGEVVALAVRDEGWGSGSGSSDGSDEADGDNDNDGQSESGSSGTHADGDGRDDDESEWGGLDD